MKFMNNIERVIITFKKDKTLKNEKNDGRER